MPNAKRIRRDAIKALMAQRAAANIDLVKYMREALESIVAFRVASGNHRRSVKRDIVALRQGAQRGSYILATSVQEAWGLNGGVAEAQELQGTVRVLVRVIKTIKGQILDEEKQVSWLKNIEACVKDMLVMDALKEAPPAFIPAPLPGQPVPDADADPGNVRGLGLDESIIAHMNGILDKALEADLQLNNLLHSLQRVGNKDKFDVGTAPIKKPMTVLKKVFRKKDNLLVPFPDPDNPPAHGLKEIKPAVINKITSEFLLGLDNQPRTLDSLTNGEQNDLDDLLDRTRTALNNDTRWEDMADWPPSVVKYGLDKIDDVVRATLEFHNPDDLAHCFKDFRKRLPLQILKSKERFTKDLGTDQGYRDDKFILRSENGTMVEVQLNAKVILEAKGKCHPLYEIVRSLPDPPVAGSTYTPPAKKKDHFEEILEELRDKFNTKHTDNEAPPANNHTWQAWATCMGNCYNELSGAAGAIAHAGKIDICKAIQTYLYDESVTEFVGNSGKTIERFTWTGDGMMPLDEMGMKLSGLETDEVPSIDDRAKSLFGYVSDTNNKSASFIQALRLQIQRQGNVALDENTFKTHAKNFFSYKKNRTSFCHLAQIYHAGVSANYKTALDNELAGQGPAGELPNADATALAAQVNGLASHTTNIFALQLLLWVLGGTVYIIDDQGTDQPVKIEDGDWDYGTNRLAGKRVPILLGRNIFANEYLTMKRT